MVVVAVATNHPATDLTAAETDCKNVIETFTTHTGTALLRHSASKWFICLNSFRQKVSGAAKNFVITLDVKNVLSKIRHHFVEKTVRLLVVTVKVQKL